MHRPTGIGELDRVLGGGLVAGSRHAARRRAGHRQEHAAARRRSAALAAAGARCLLVGARGVAAAGRASAPSALGALHPELLLVGTSRRSRRRRARRRAARPTCSPIDSIQTSLDPELAGAPDRSPRSASARRRLVALAKRPRPADVLVGHVTKDGALAGPRAARARRRHGALVRRRPPPRPALPPRGQAPVRRHQRARPVRDDVATASPTSPTPRALFLADRRPARPGRSSRRSSRARVRCSSRCRRSSRGADAPVPRRVASGLDGDRLALLLAVLERTRRRRRRGADVYASVAGGVRVERARRRPRDRAGRRRDASLACARRGDRRRWARSGWAARSVRCAQAERRLSEAARLGFRRAIGPPSMPRVRGDEPGRGRPRSPTRWPRLAYGTEGGTARAA